MRNAPLAPNATLPPPLHAPSIIAHRPFPHHGPDYPPCGNPLVHWSAAPSDVQNTQEPRRPDIRRFYLTNYLNKLHQDGGPLPPETPPLGPAEKSHSGLVADQSENVPLHFFHSEKKHECSCCTQALASFTTKLSSAKVKPHVDNFTQRFYV